MSEHENELKKALAENGNFDAEKAEKEINQARQWFESRLKWSGRFAWMRIIFFVAVFEVASANFLIVGSTRAMIGYAAAMVVAIVLVGVIAVQSWVAVAKISMLREIKLLRLECLGRPTGQVVQAGWRDSTTVLSTRRALSVCEFIAWLLALVVIAGASAFVTLRFSARSWPASMAHFEGTPVTLNAPHVGAPIYVHVYLRMDHGQCKVSRITPEHKEAMWFLMGGGSWQSQLPPGDSLRLDPQGNKGEYWVRFE